MKKILLFAIVIFAFFLFAAATFAQEITFDDVVPTVTPIPTPAPVKYDLAFPGVLPDSPFYKLKVLRDRVVGFFITDPKQKIEYYLLQTDKGVLAAAMLVDKGKNKLAGETALKAENNYTLLTQQLGALPVKPEDDFFKKLETAALKHQAVMESLSKRVKGDDKKTFEQVKDFSQRNWETIKDFQEQL